MSTSELACTYAALLLHDDGQEVTARPRPRPRVVGAGLRCCAWLKRCASPFFLQADKLATVIKAAGVTIEPYWAGLFAKLLATKDVGSLITNVGARPASAGKALAGRAAPLRAPVSGSRVGRTAPRMFALPGAPRRRR